MNKSNKRALYESIMKNISKQIKRTLNESLEDNPGLYIDNANLKFRKLFNSIFSIQTKIPSLISDPDYNDTIISRTLPFIVEAKCMEKIEKVFNIENECKKEAVSKLNFISDIINFEIRAINGNLSNLSGFKKLNILDQNAFVLYPEFKYKDGILSIEKIYVYFPKCMSDFNNITNSDYYIDKTKVDDFDIYKLLNNELYNDFTDIFNIASKKGITLKIQQKNNAYKTVKDVNDLFVSIQPLSESENELNLLYISNLELAEVTSDYLILGDKNNEYSNIHIIIEGEKIQDFLEDLENQ